MSAVQLLRPGCPEPLARVVEIPGVEVDHLRPLNRDDSTDLPGHDGPRMARSDRDNDAIDECAPLRVLGDAAV
jgi:hypothetical protein